MVKRVSMVMVALMALAYPAAAQYSMTLQNDAMVAGNTAYEFDVFIASTSGTINLTSYQLFFTYNTAIAGSGTLSFSYVAASSALTNPPTLGVGIYADGVSNLGAASNAGSDNITTTPVKVGRFRISNTVVFASQQANVAWDFGGALATLVNVNNGNVTNQTNHTSSLVNSPLPIQLASFSAAMVSGNAVKISWATISETQNYGFEVQRSASRTSGFASLPGSFIAGHGTTVERHEYAFTDATAGTGKSYYRLKQIDMDATVHYNEPIEPAGTSDVKEQAPVVFALLQNYPNPFNPSTEIKFSVETAGRTVLRIFNILGAEVATLFDGAAEPGQYYRVKLDGSRMASGIYFYRLESERKSDLKKMVLLK